MKNAHRMIAIAGAICLASTVAVGAEISNLSGQSCGADEGTWHFVNNQTGGAGPGTLTAVIGGQLCIVGPSKVNNNTQHFYCPGSGALQSASTDLPGRLVLSDFTCTKKDEEPPKK